MRLGAGRINKGGRSVQQRWFGDGGGVVITHRRMIVKVGPQLAGIPPVQDVTQNRSSTRLSLSVSLQTQEECHTCSFAVTGCTGIKLRIGAAHTSQPDRDILGIGI